MKNLLNACLIFCVIGLAQGYAMGDFLQVNTPRIGATVFPTGTKAADIQSVDQVGAGLQILSKELQDIFQKRSDYFADELQVAADRAKEGYDADELQFAADRAKEGYDLYVIGEKSKVNIYENPLSSIFNSNFSAVKAAVDSSVYLDVPNQINFLFKYQLEASETLVHSWIDKTPNATIASFDAWVAKTRKESPDFLGADFMHWAHNQINTSNKSKRGTRNR